MKTTNRKRFCPVGFVPFYSVQPQYYQSVSASRSSQISAVVNNIYTLIYIRFVGITVVVKQCFKRATGIWLEGLPERRITLLARQQAQRVSVWGFHED